MNRSPFISPRRDATTWPLILATAMTEEQVLRVVRDFLAGWTPYELALLPRQCRPPARFATCEEVVSYAFAIAQARCNDNEADPSLVRMCSFFSEAAEQVAAVMSEAEKARPADA